MSTILSAVITTDMMWSSFMPVFLKYVLPVAAVCTILGIAKALLENKLDKKAKERENKKQEEIAKNAIKRAMKEIEEEKARR